MIIIDSSESYSGRLSSKKEREMRSIIIAVFLWILAFDVMGQGVDVGELTWVEGSVKVEYPLRPQQDGRIGMKVGLNATLLTGENSKAVVRLLDGTILSIAPKTKILIESLVKDPEKRKASVLTFVGKVRAVIKKQLGSESKFEFKSKTAIAGVRGTHLALDVAEDGTTKVMLISGFVGVFNRDMMDLAEIFLTEGTFSEVKEGMAPSPPQPLTPEMLKDIYVNTSMQAFIKNEIKNKASKSGEIPLDTKSLSGNFEELLLTSLMEIEKEEISRSGAFSQSLTVPLREQDIQGVVAPQDFSGGVDSRNLNVNVFVDINNY